MTATELYIANLCSLKNGELALLRLHAGRSLDESIEAFDLFSGLWWPLRQTTSKAPRREVAWLVAKLYARTPLINTPGAMLASELRRCEPIETRAQLRFQQNFDMLLLSSLELVEPRLAWALSCISSRGKRLDWARLTDDLSIWQRENTRLRWANAYLAEHEREITC